MLILRTLWQSYVMAALPTSAFEPHTLAVQQTFVRHQSALLAYVLSIEPNFADAQDIVQLTFQTITRKASTWTAGTDFLAWACTVARYETLNFQRTRARRVARLDDNVVELLYADELLDAAEWQRQSDVLQTCLDGLSRRARELVWLRYHRAQMPEQIAPVVGWTVNSVRVALTRVRIALRKCMEEQLSEGEKA